MISPVWRARSSVDANTDRTSSTAAAATASLLPPEVGQLGVGLALPPAQRVPLGLAVADQQQTGGHWGEGIHHR